MGQRELGVVTVHGGPHDGERFATPVERLAENAPIYYLDGRYQLARDPKSGRWRAFRLPDE